MKNKNVRGIISLAVVTALSFGVIMGSKALAKDMGPGASNAAEEQVKEEINTKGADGIEKAVKTENGYRVTAKVKGYGGDIIMNVSFDAEKKKVTKVEITEQNETEGLGAKVADAEFLSQFEGVEAPVFLPGMSLEKEEKVSDEELLKELKDGTYEAKAKAPDNNGFTDQVTLKVKDGKIAEVNWEAVGADGNTKSVLSENGEYVMTEDGLTWKEQAEALAKAVVEKQSLSFLNLDDQGKTDAVSGVSISIGGFTALAEECLKEAAGIVKNVELKDGNYEAKSESADNSGFISQVTMTVKDGKITQINWDAVKEDGSKKSVLSENGEYVMTENGPTWKEQAEAIAKAVIENQSLDFLNLDEQGKTDAVSGVSISIGDFMSLAEQCINEAAGIEKEEVPENGTQVDAVSGATISSTAVVTGINTAFEFLQTVK